MEEEGKWVTVRGRRVFIKEGQTISEAIQEYESKKNQTSTTYYRGLTQKYDPNYDKSKLDNPNAYESWTDSLELAKEYAGKDGYVYSVEIPNKELNTDDIFDEEGERSLMYYNDKPVALHGVEGEEFMLYTDHEKWNDLEYKEVSETESKEFNTNYLSSKYDEDEFHDKFWEMSDISYDKLSKEDRDLINSDYVRTENSTWINSTLREKEYDELSDKRKAQVDALDRATQTYQHDENLTVKRFDQRDLLRNVYGVNTDLPREELAQEMKQHIGETRTERGYMSASLDESGNGMWDNLLVHSEINIPAGNNMYVTENLGESEIILPRNTSLQLKDVQFKESAIPGMEKEYGKIVLKYEVVPAPKEYNSYDYVEKDSKEYYNKLGEEKFNEPTNMYLNRYISYGQQRIPETDLKIIESNIRELSKPAKEDFIVYHGKNKNDDISDRLVLSTTLNHQVAKMYSHYGKKEDGEVIEIRVNKDTPIISTYNSRYTNKIGGDEHFHWENQSEIVLIPGECNLVEVRPGVWEISKKQK